MGTVIAGITLEVKLNVLIGNFAIEMNKIVLRDLDRIQNLEIYKENPYAKNLAKITMIQEDTVLVVQMLR